MAAYGANEARVSIACHLGRNPRKGGRPARDRKDRVRRSLWRVGTFVRDEIFLDVSCRESSRSIISRVEIE